MRTSEPVQQLYNTQPPRIKTTSSAKSHKPRPSPSGAGRLQEAQPPPQHLAPSCGAAPSAPGGGLVPPMAWIHSAAFLRMTTLAATTCAARQSR
ncbi:hypothetical protein NHX12_021453 [Muraenolepis orangiensis]|uniref:Uncharacterized protein n=1 Tax=Muraenolepis orangiensis TaxID=630683 RepID=A0A9Q0ES59_9TELE|nr:hypothetical protein NHX12_021453 [Muraenolepis orangiensis]